MKKSLFALMAAAIAVLSSCVKEAAAPTVEESAAGTFKIIGRIDNDATKTHYVESGSVATLNWIQGDRIKLIVYSKDAPFTADCYTFYSTGDGTTVSFEKIGSGDPDFTNYPPANLAVYPSGLTTGGVKDAYTVTLSGEYTVDSGSDLTKVGVPMIGAATDPENANTYVFTPAVGVLKVQLKNVPGTARKLVLDAGTDAVSGKFPLDADKGFRMVDADEAGNVVTVNFPAQADGANLDIYVPVPVGTISAGATFKIQDADDNPIFTTPATTKAIEVVKGHLTPIYPITVSEWSYLGKGKFIDNFMWYMMNLANSNEEVGYVDVDIAQSTVDNTKYRVSNPYGQVAGVIQNADHDDYLEFTVDGEGAVSFSAHQTGWISSGCNVQLQELDDDVTKLILGTGANPEIVQLAPKYASTGSFNYSRHLRENMIRIAFPGVYEQHCASISISESNLSSGVSYTNANTPNKLTVTTSNNPLYYYYSGYSDQSLPATCKSNTNGSGVVTKAEMGVNDGAHDIETSGVKYLYWSTFASNGSTVLFQGCQRFYFLTTQDETAIVGNYSHNTSDGCQHPSSPNPVPTTSNFTFIVSTDPISSNLMLSQFDGMDCVEKIPALYDNASGKIVLYNDINFDGAKRLSRTSKMEVSLNLVFTVDTKSSFYADSSFGYVLRTYHPTEGYQINTWQYYYVAGDSTHHLYEKE